MGAEPLAQLLLRDGSDQPVDLGGVTEQDQERDTADLIALRQLRRVVGVELDHLQPAGILVTDAFDDRRHDAARSTPGGPKSTSTGTEAWSSSSKVAGEASTIHGRSV